VDYIELIKKYITMQGYTNDYIDKLKRYIAHCNTNNIDILNMDFSKFSDYILLLKNNKLNNGTINNHIKAVRFLYSYLVISNMVDSKVLAEITKIKLLPVERRIKDYITKKELDELIRIAVGYKTSFSPYKTQALLYFMFYTGMRRNELINLMRKDINLEDNSAIVRIPTKNRQERIIFYPKRVSMLLKDYFDTEQEEKNAFNISRGILDNLIRFLKNFAPNGKNVTPHTFRHSFANMLAEKGIDIRIAQKLLGHKSIQSTMIYYDPDIKTIQKLYKKYIK